MPPASGSKRLRVFKLRKFETQGVRLKPSFLKAFGS
jgi:hypothetical protein